METGTFITEGSPALMLEFVSVLNESAGENSGIVVPVQTDRGTIWQIILGADDEKPISKYGKLFVGLLVVLSVGFIISSVLKKKRRDKNKIAQTVDVEEDAQPTNDTARDDQVTEAAISTRQMELGDEKSGEAEAKSGTNGWGVFGNLFAKRPKEKMEHIQTPMLDQIELDIPKDCSDEVEISLSNSNDKKVCR